MRGPRCCGPAARFLAALQAGTAATALMGMSAVTASPQANSVAQIVSPADGSKLHPGQSVAIRIRVEGSATQVTWRLTLAPGDGSELASGVSPTSPDTIVATVHRDALDVGRPYRLVLEAEEPNGPTARAEVTLVAPDADYALIPLEEGNLSRNRFHGLSTDDDGRLIAMGGSTSGEILLRSPGVGSETKITVPLAATEGQTLAGTGQRFFFVGELTDEGGALTLGVGYRELATGATELVGARAPFGLFTINRQGNRVAFQRPPDPEDRGISNLQYFIHDEASDETRQITSAEGAIRFTSDPAVCPTTGGTKPLMTADGDHVILTSRATFGLAPEELSGVCHIFRYEWQSGAMRYLTSLPPGNSLTAPSVSEDGRWLAFTNNLTPPASAMPRVVPALLDLASGELRSPVSIALEGGLDATVASGGLVVISSFSDLDPRVANRDGNLELFLFDVSRDTFHQITQTIGGVEPGPGRCAPYRPRLSRDAATALFSFYLVSVESCILSEPQRNEVDGFAFRTVRAVRKRAGNRAPDFAPPGDVRVLAGQSIELTLRATDPDGDPLVFFAQEMGGVDVPAGSEITDHRDGSATFSWPTRPEDAGDYTLRVAAFDEGGGEVFHDVAIAVISKVACGGDCDGDGRVAIGELIIGVRMALADAGVESCSDADLDGSGAVTINELVQATNYAIDGCPPAAAE